jgi:hypothetical protein
MHNKIFCLYLAWVPLFQSVYCQNIEIINRGLSEFSAEVQFRNAGDVPSHSNVDGTEYFDENFVKGEIFTAQSEHYLDIPMRYNVFKDRMEVKLADGNIYDLTDHTKISQILFKNRTLVYSDFDAGKIKGSGYLFMLYNGKSTLYSRYIKLFVKGVEETNGITPSLPDKIVDRPREYYIKLTDGIPRIFKSKNDLLDLLNKRASEMEDFLKKQKLKLNNEDDLIKALTYYDSIQ